MWKRITRKLRKDRKEVTDDRTQFNIYAVGDVHGRADLLHDVFKRIDEDLVQDPSSLSIQVFLGDYIDRGPDSAEVIEALERRRRTAEIVCLRGNHEAILLNFLQDPEVLGSWRQLGGLQTLKSYGLAPTTNPDILERRQLAAQLSQRMPSSHISFLQSLPLSFDLGQFFFAHAGVRPGVPLDQQRERDLLWIRDEFLLSEEDFGKTVVHGHTPVSSPEFLHNRINIDTGAYATGRLTCLKLRGTDRRLL